MGNNLVIRKAELSKKPEAIMLLKQSGQPSEWVMRDSEVILLVSDHCILGIAGAEWTDSDFAVLHHWISSEAAKMDGELLRLAFVVAETRPIKRVYVYGPVLQIDARRHIQLVRMMPTSIAAVIGNGEVDGGFYDSRLTEGALLREFARVISRSLYASTFEEVRDLHLKLD